jgi:glycosyltransferase involved in cell wall biosynthesis
MRACFIAYKFYESNTRIMQMASALAEQGYSVDVFALRRQEQTEHEMLGAINVYRIQTRVVDERSRFSYLWRMLRFVCVSAYTVTRRHLDEPYQLIQIQSVPEFLVFAAIIPKVLGTSIVLDAYDLLPEFYAIKFSSGDHSVSLWLLKILERWSVALANHVLAANDIWCERLVSRSCSSAKCTTACYYPDLKLFSRPTRTRRRERFTLLYAGTLNWYQGLDVAIRAFRRIAGRIPDWDFHIYGEGPSKPSLTDLVSRIGLQGRVAFHPMVPAVEVAEVMANSDLAVVPKRTSSQFGNEAASTKILEFLALGIPVVAARSRVETYYFDDSTIEFFQSENESSLAASILSLTQSSPRREELIRNGMKYIEVNNWQQKKHLYLELIDSLVGKRRKPPDWNGGLGKDQRSSSGNEPLRRDRVATSSRG